jgi:hypothetical protein
VNVVTERRHRLRGVAAAALGSIAVVATAIAPVSAATPAVRGIGATSIDTPVRASRTVTPDASFALVRVASGYDNLSFATSPAGDRRLFVVEQRGVIKIVGQTTPFLDIQDRVHYSGEQGLLGMAFHPSYASTTSPNRGRFFVYYTGNDGNNHVKEYRRSTTAVASRTEYPILTIPHPTQGNHNGGMIAFGADGMLFIATGDGGGSGDPYENGQKLTTLLGKILRINVNVSSRYAIPSNNPWASSTSYKREIWSYGLRNPWRFSFNGWNLWIGDVGQGSYEEVDRSYGASPTVGGRGANYGWDQYEARMCYEGPCSSSGKTFPIASYRTHDYGRCAITGGYVYNGHYFFADYCSGTIYSIPATGSTITTRQDTSLNITSFGRGYDGRIYVLSTSGSVFRVDFTP